MNLAVELIKETEDEEKLKAAIEHCRLISNVAFDRLEHLKKQNTYFWERTPTEDTGKEPIWTEWGNRYHTLASAINNTPMFQARYTYRLVHTGKDLRESLLLFPVR